MTMDLGQNNKNVLYVEDGLQKAQHYCAMIVVLVASEKSVAYVKNGLREIWLWFAMNTRGGVLDVVGIFKLLYI